MAQKLDNETMVKKVLASPIVLKGFNKNKTLMQMVDFLAILEQENIEIKKIKISYNLYTYLRVNYYNTFITFVTKYETKITTRFNIKNSISVFF